MLPQINENLNWPKPATHVGLICCLWRLSTEHWDNIGEIWIYFARYGFFHLVPSRHQCTSSAAPSTFLVGLCRPEPPAQHDPRSRWESCSGWTLIQRCSVKVPWLVITAMLRRRMAALVQSPNYFLIFWVWQGTAQPGGPQTGWLLFPLPSAHDSSWSIPGHWLSAPAHLLGQALGRGVLWSALCALVLLLVQWDITDKQPWIIKVWLHLVSVHSGGLLQGAVRREHAPAPSTAVCGLLLKKIINNRSTHPSPGGS